MTPEAPSRRLFTALWPDAAQRQQLRQLLQTLPRPPRGHPVKADNWHITLKYLGACNAGQQACLEQQLQGLAIPRIELRLDHSGCFPRPQVAWLGCHRVPPPLAALVGALEEGLHRACGFTPEGRDYRPHLSTWRKVRDYPQLELASPLSLRFEGLALVESLSTPTGVHYQLLKTYPANR